MGARGMVYNSDMAIPLRRSSPSFDSSTPHDCTCSSFPVVGRISSRGRFVRRIIQPSSSTLSPCASSWGTDEKPICWLPLAVATELVSPRSGRGLLTSSSCSGKMVQGEYFCPRSRYFLVSGVCLSIRSFLRWPTMGRVERKQS